MTKTPSEDALEDVTESLNAQCDEDLTRFACELSTHPGAAERYAFRMGWIVGQKRSLAETLQMFATLRKDLTS